MARLVQGATRQMAKRKPTQIVQVGTRMPESLRARLEKAAKAAGVSLNGEIVRRLERSCEWETLEDLFQTVFRPSLEEMDKLQKKWEASSRLYEERLKDLAAAKGEVPTHADAATRKAELVVEAPSSLAQRLKAEERRRDAEAEATRKAELVVEARHLSGNPNMLVDEALTYLAKRGNATAEAILNELQHRTPIKPLKRAWVKS